ncbi:hypothetical protein EV702DRAFT_1233960 [Suillus placidus]|uniref:Uncharacterized protein n=1 Tax=Suillus placidus TaxID=48579 RepID=A0A9P6ZS32_9AGAM|nr:hypothetical protein EV702DRAFT_1233960 [Suillus placidus]
MGRGLILPSSFPLSGPLPDPFADSAPPRYQFQQGAYMQDSLQIQALLERCRALELREVQLSTERDTIKAMFERLASSIRSDLLQSDSTVIGPSSADSTRPTCQLYPGISFWTQDDFMEWLETASSRTADCGKLPYLEDADGAPVPETTIKAIRKLLWGGWSELLSRKMALQSWGKVSASGRQLIILQHRHILPGAGTTSTVTTITSLETASRKKKKKPMTTTTTTLPMNRLARSAGAQHEFCIYYNSLSQGQRKEYDDEASKLIAEGNWNKTAIVAGKMY